MQGWFNASKESLVTRSLLALTCVYVWEQGLVYLTWQLADRQLDLTVPSLCVFALWLVFILEREYDVESDEINASTVNILFLSPRNTYEVIKGLLGIPVASICIVAGGYVFAYRSSGKFEKTMYTNLWAKRHIVIDTKVPFQSVFSALEQEIGEPRKPYTKCVWTIRHALNRLGGKYQIKSPLDYIPAFYALRIIKRNNNV
jgi:hypothetical protein